MMTTVRSWMSQASQVCSQVGDQALEFVDSFKRGIELGQQGASVEDVIADGNQREFRKVQARLKAKAIIPEIGRYFQGLETSFTVEEKAFLDTIQCKLILKYTSNPKLSSQEAADYVYKIVFESCLCA